MAKLPNLDRALQAEGQKPLDAGRAGGAFIAREDELPRLISHVQESGAKEEMMSPGDAGGDFRVSFDEQHGVEENLRMKYVDTNAIERSTQRFSK